jgi:hypothetical protein
MRRISVVATIRDAYMFATSHLGGVIGLIWVPMLLATVMGFFSSQRYYNDIIDAIAGGNVSAMGSSVLMMLGYLVAALLLYAIMLVAAVQLALGARSAPAIAHFAFGTLEWRMFRAFIAFIGLVLLLTIPAFALADAASGWAGSRLPQAAAPFFLAALLYGIVLLAMPRFFALLPAIAVAETAPVLRRAWMLSAGNYWRLVVVMLAILGPMVVLFIGLEIFLAQHNPVAGGGSQQEQLVASLMQARRTLPMIAGLSFLVSPLLVGLLAGASVSAWRALKDEPALDIEA